MKKSLLLLLSITSTSVFCMSQQVYEFRAYEIAQAYQTTTQLGRDAIHYAALQVVADNDPYTPLTNEQYIPILTELKILPHGLRYLSKTTRQILLEKYVPQAHEDLRKKSIAHVRNCYEQSESECQESFCTAYCKAKGATPNDPIVSTTWCIDILRKWHFIDAHNVLNPWIHTILCNNYSHIYGKRTDLYIIPQSPATDSYRAQIAAKAKTEPAK